MRSLLNQLFERIAMPSSTNRITGGRCHLDARSDHAVAAVEDGWTTFTKSFEIFAETRKGRDNLDF